MLASMKGGLLKNFTRRAIIAADTEWWQTDHSDWKLSIEHPLANPESATPDFWLDRVLDLCENEITHEYFGLTFDSLIKMDPATFDKIERRIYDFAKRQSEKLSPDLKKELGRK